MTGPLVPDVATCAVCGVMANTSELANSRFPDGGYRWVCREVHACARNLAAARDLSTRRVLGADLAPELGAGASPRHLRMRAQRMTELAAGTGPDSDT